jgi:ParB family chromosome partitioning protein
MADENRPRLGRGLAALIGDAGAEDASLDRVRTPRRVPIEFLRPNPRNPRKNFDVSNLEELAASLREKGLIQPIVVRPLAAVPDNYEIIAGERRWRAAQMAGLHDIPIVLMEVSDREALELAIVENVQRADLNALEEAQGYDQLMHEFGYAQADLAKMVGKSRSHVANTLRLLHHSGPVKKLIEEGSLSAGHARALLSVRQPDKIAERTVKEGLSVRDIERIAQDEAAAQPEPAEAARLQRKAEKDADTRSLERTLTDALGMTVLVNHRGERGEIRIRYKTLEQLDSLRERLSR